MRKTSRNQWLVAFLVMTAFWVAFYLVFDGQLRILMSIAGAAVVLLASAAGERLRERRRRRKRGSDAHTARG